MNPSNSSYISYLFIIGLGIANIALSGVQTTLARLQIMDFLPCGLMSTCAALIFLIASSIRNSGSKYSTNTATVTAVKTVITMLFTLTSDLYYNLWFGSWFVVYTVAFFLASQFRSFSRTLTVIFFATVVAFIKLVLFARFFLHFSILSYAMEVSVVALFTPLVIRYVPNQLMLPK